MPRWPIPVSVLLFSWSCAGCSGQGVAEPGATAGRGALPELDMELDLDGDGLCDVTEDEVGTDARLVDTDGDRFPDPVEVALGYQPTDVASPSSAQVAYLSAQPGARIDFDVRLTVDGAGAAYAGAFQPTPALFDVGHSAADFFAGAEAAGADPVDNLRASVDGTERFGAILGPTRLRFVLHFENPLGADANPACAVAHPFRYLVKDGAGEPVSRERYLLVLVPPGTAPDAADYCTPEACL